MKLQVLTLEYMGWCPGIGAAAQFIPNKEISKTLVYALITIAALGVGVPYLLFFEPTTLPAWIIAEKIGPPKEYGTFIEVFFYVNEQALSEYPKLAIAIHQADWASRPGFDLTPPGPWVKMTYDEARAVASLIGDEYMITTKTYVYKIGLNGNWYRVLICFGEKPPILL